MLLGERPDEQRIVITSAGAVTSCGEGIDALANAVFDGRSPLRAGTFDDGGPCIGGPVDPAWLAPFGDVDPTIACALTAAEQALTSLPVEQREQLGVFVASGKPPMHLFERVHAEFLRQGSRAIPADFIWQFTPSAPTDAIAARFGCGGLRLPVVGACSTGLDAIAMAARRVRLGDGAPILAGSSEASLTPFMTAAFERLGVLANTTPDPTRAIRPFSSNRAGFLIGEGAGVVVIESLASARARGTEILSEVSGWAVVSDAHHITTLRRDGSGIAHAIQAALKSAGLPPEVIDHVNAHGTATALNDVIETRGLRTAFGAHADSLKICSTKPVTGHLLSASGSVELIVTLEAIRRGVVPPTLNLNEPDPACDLDYTPHRAVVCPIRHALVLNYGFGSHVGAVVLSQYAGR